MAAMAANSASSLKTSPSPTSVHGVLLTNQLLFSLMHGLVNPALGFIPPFCFAFGRLVIALPFLSTVAFFSDGTLAKVDYRIAKYIVALGILGIALPQSLIYVGNHLAGAAITSCFAPVTPVMTAFFGWVLGKDRLTWRIVLGLTLCCAGTVLFVNVSDVDLKSRRTAGIFVMFFQSCNYGAFLLLSRMTLALFPYPALMMALASSVASAFLLVVVLASQQFLEIDWGAPYYAWLALLYAGLLVSCYAHTANSWTTQHISPTITAMYGTVQPVAGSAYAVVVLGEQFGAKEALGVTCICVGLLCTTLPLPGRATQGALGKGGNEGGREGTQLEGTEREQEGEKSGDRAGEEPPPPKLHVSVSSDHLLEPRM